jgi:hypothetical protein
MMNREEGIGMGNEIVKGVMKVQIIYWVSRLVCGAPSSIKLIISDLE